MPFKCDLQRYNEGHLSECCGAAGVSDAVGLYTLSAIDPQLERRPGFNQ